MFDMTRHAARLLAASAAALLLASCGGSSNDTPAPPPFGQTTYVIGSSLSDNGNQCTARPSECLPTPPAFQQLDSNGSLWVTTVAAKYGAAVVPSLKGGTNFAYADARTGVVPSDGANAPSPAIAPSLVQQTEAVLARAGYAINPQNLVIVDAGGAFANNSSAALDLVVRNLPNAQAIATNTVIAAVTDVTGVLIRLSAAGARNIVVLNSPNLSTTPLAVATAQALNSPLVTTLLVTMAGGFNQNLTAQINGLKSITPGLNVYVIDAFTLQNQVQANPSAFGFQFADRPCFLQATATTPQFLCSTDINVQNLYFFWDLQHPTTATHQLIAKAAIDAIGR